MTNKLKLWLLWFILWEIVVLWYKDEELKGKVGAEWNLKNKISVVFKELVDLNKKIFDDIFDLDYNQRFVDLNSYIDDKMVNINEMIWNLRVRFNDLSEQQIKPMIKKIEDEISVLKEHLRDWVNDVKEKMKLEEKIEFLSTKLNELKDKFAKKQPVGEDKN